MPEKKRILGIDENGLGPLMGPLVITGVLLRYGGKDVWFDGISDSKEFFSRNIDRFSQLEDTVLSLFYLLEGRTPSSPVEILENFCVKYDCLSGLNICTRNIPDRFIWSEGKKCEELSGWMGKNGIEIEKIQSIALCPKRINNFIEKGDHKFLLNLSAFCDIIKNLPDKNMLSVYAGRVGGLKFYKKYLTYYLYDYQCETIEEKEDVSLYRMEGDNETFTMGFYTDVEKKSFPAAIASIIGKYIRELFMAGIRKTLGISEDISGYHDRRTKKFVPSISPERFPSDCIFRSK
ncbi:MAG: hypothetical protein N3D17_03710 [bacterium]|nr:hypothetical protein [bacterium]